MFNHLLNVFGDKKVSLGNFMVHFPGASIMVVYMCLTLTQIVIDDLIMIAPQEMTHKIHHKHFWSQCTKI